MQKKFAVVGGTGAMGKIIVQDLFDSNKENQILIIGRDKKKLTAALKQYRSKRVKAKTANVKDVNSLAKAVKGCSVLINSVQYELNLQVMEAVLKAKVHYIDLGGLFYMTRQQLKLHKKFKKAGLTAVLGMGAAPGLTNIMAKLGADKLDRIKGIHIQIGGADFTKFPTNIPLAFAYSIQTLLEEHNKQPIIFTKGRFKQVEPRSGKETFNFPKPIGKVTGIYTLHSEVATLPLSFRHKGIEECTFKISFDEEFEKKMNLFAELGLSSTKPIEFKGIKITPLEFLAKVLNKIPQPKSCPNDIELVRVIVNGKLKGKNKTVIADVLVKSDKKHCFHAGDVDTGIPPSIVAQMIVNNQLTERGALPPEKCVSPEIFFKELKKRKMRLTLRIKKN